MTRYGKLIRAAAEEFDVPAPLIVATILTESGGKARSRRNEPGFITPDKTPHRGSAGLTHTLLKTARMALAQPELPLSALYDPETSIRAGVCYIAIQRPRTHLDPVVVSAAYNSGGVYRERATANPWRLRCYPMGTGAHITRFVEWYGDALSVLGG